MRASGAIMSGGGGSGPLEDEAMANAGDVVEALETASQAKDVRAIVLRIDSPGGTYPAADAIADAVGRARAAGKPVIVSMGDVAASGGYLAAVRGDVIVAQPTTITASIGVFSMWPMAQEVAESRNLDANRIDAAARGRVFSGIDARQAGLVDELGGLQLALNIAKAKAGIDETRKVEIRRYPDETDRIQRIVDSLLKLVGVTATPSMGMPREVREALAKFGVATRPGNVRLPPLPPLWR